ncbi:DUF427 domain-containing protein [Synechococcus sp. BS55D]|uniref:DUF427 domain-containing protein n=1 Tax=Synechococcus sp. BS55D TaxID=2055943 RepID=UPI0010403E80|nr:DUF427 domain-containing protein [Synechococcus sp. BS55D]TCD57172.1 hypothetical protein CWE16_05220 [Synechococcus sp. BS55D]
MVQERVADYPRPPRLEPSSDLVLVKVAGEVLYEGTGTWRVLETFHPPTYYLPPEGIKQSLLHPAVGRSFCEWKGVAEYFDIVAGGRRIHRAVWRYPTPTADFKAIQGWFALYPALMDGCWLNGEPVIPQPGGFYGGWISSAVVGPFKGDPAHPELI